MANQYTRKELYDLVWSVPINTLADRFGLSGRGLAKICDRHQIPVPGRGYWARIEAGQVVGQTPLWKIHNPAIERVTLWRQHIHPDVAIAREATKQARKTIAAPAQDKTITLRDSRKLHPSLGPYADALRKAIPDHEGGVRVLSGLFHQSMIRRLLTFLNTLAYELQSSGIQFAMGNCFPEFHRGSSNVHFEITSPKKRIPGRPGSWRKFENVFAGRLAIRLFGNAHGIRTSWVDKDNVVIERDLEQIAASILIVLAVQEQIDERKRAEERRAAYEAHRADLMRKRDEREKARKAFVDQIAQDRQKVARLNETIALLPAGSIPGDIERMMDWAKGQLALLEQRTSIEAIQERLAETRLFPDHDDLADPGPYTVQKTI